MDLSISIVSYNQLTNLSKCIASLQTHIEGISYEVIVVAYRFTPQNLVSLRDTFPEIIIIESNEIRGFSENYNLALKSARGTYCLVLNDDAFFLDSTVMTLMETFDLVPEARFVSPVILNGDGSIQVCGRGKYTLINWFLSQTPFGTNINANKRNLAKKSTFRTASLSGCCFMARRQDLVDLGFFCEDYFFTPEDIALSLEAEKKGYGMYVNPAAKVVHQHWSTAGTIHDIILPVALRGVFLLIGRQHNRVIEILFRLYTLALHSVMYLLWHFRRREDKKIWIPACKNVIRFSFSFLPPKTLFMRLARERAIL